MLANIVILSENEWIIHKLSVDYEPCYAHTFHCIINKANVKIKADLRNACPLFNFYF